MSNENKNKKRSLLIALAVILILFGSVYTGYYLYSQYTARLEEDKITTSDFSEPTEKLVKNPIDFASLQKQNDEIYAWIKVPGTKVNYPVVQSAVDDDFYLKHSAIDKSWVASGAVYTEQSNTKTWRDRVTVVYGHNGYSDTMFTTLHRFEEKEFFNKHRYFYIYTPESRLTYQIVSAFKYDDRHIMNSFDFLDNAVFRSFLNMISDPKSAVRNTATRLDKELDESDKVVVLSTCITNQKSSRYLVCGVLIKDEKTN